MTISKKAQAEAADAELWEQVMEAMNLSRDEIIRRLKLQMEKHGWAQPPISAVITVLLEFVTAEKITALIKAMAPALQQLASTGKGPVGRSDKSALA